jgi:hypothetical protein
VNSRLGTGRPLRDQLEPGVAAGGLGDDLVGEPDDLRRGPVVAHQPDLGRPGEALAEAEQVVRRGPGEAVDRLLRVADDAQVVAPPSQASSSRCCSGVTSWYSSTTKER